MKYIPKFNIEVLNKADNVAEINIDGEVGGASFDGEDLQWNTLGSIKKQLKQIAELSVNKIVVNISSPGGYVDEGLAIHDALRSQAANGTKVETRITGMTASAATIIAQAGDIRSMSDNALYLVHKAWGFAMGNANDFEAQVSDLRKIDGVIANIYSKRSGKDTSVFDELMSENNGDGKWLDATEAKELGLIDNVLEPSKAAAAFTKDMFRNYGLPMPKSGIELKNERTSNEAVTAQGARNREIELLKLKTI